MRPYRLLFDHVLTRVDAERAHRAAMAGLRAVQPAALRLPARSRQAARPGPGPVHALGLRFAHPLGLAAGLDKNAVAVDALAALGFGHVEVGTVTALPQPGNPAPRLFRLPEDRAIVNRMGFNNQGAEAVSRRLARRAAARAGSPGRPGPVLGVNIGRSRVVPDDDAAAVAADHATSTRLLAPWADYLVVNVSSPNTPGLRDLQAVERLAPLLGTVRRAADEASAERRVPLLVKIAPDLDDADVLAVADLALATGLDGIIATNTTLSREGLASDPDAVAAVGAGGLSGEPLRARALEVLRLLAGRVGDDLTLVGVGGISDAADARERLDAGARLVQAYSGFVYGGVRWPSTLLRGLGGAEES